MGGSHSSKVHPVLESFRVAHLTRAHSNEEEVLELQRLVVTRVKVLPGTGLDECERPSVVEIAEVAFLNAITCSFLRIIIIKLSHCAKRHHLINSSFRIINI